jgi:spore germination protein GerM
VSRRVLVVALALWLAGCGVPTGDEPQVIPASEVPYGLAEQTPTPAAPGTATPVEAPSRIFLLSPDELLVGVPREVDGTSVREQLADLLEHLAAGPSDAEREQQLSTLLTPEVRLTLTDLADRTATIDLGVPTGAPSGAAGRRAVAQLVLTATGLRGVDAVQLTIGGDPVEAPLPTGELTSAPLTSADYAVFLSGSAQPPR